MTVSEAHFSNDSLAESVQSKHDFSKFTALRAPAVP